MNHDGWICLHRQILEDEIWDQPPSVRVLFIHLLLKASHRPYRSLKSGQFRSSTRILAVEVACATQTVTDGLKWLEAQGMISRDRKLAGTSSTVFTIKKWKEYQEIPRGSVLEQDTQGSTQGSTQGVLMVSTHNNKTTVQPSTTHSTSGSGETKPKKEPTAGAVKCVEYWNAAHPKGQNPPDRAALQVALLKRGKYFEDVDTFIRQAKQEGRKQDQIVAIFKFACDVSTPTYIRTPSKLKTKDRETGEFFWQKSETAMESADGKPNRREEEFDADRAELFGTTGQQ